MFEKEIAKMNYLLFKHNKNILYGKGNQYFLDLFDYYVRYLWVYADDDMDVSKLMDKDIFINKYLEKSFNQYVKTMNDIQAYVNIIKNEEKKKYYIERLFPYFDKPFKYNLFDEYSGYWFVTEKGGFGYKNNLLSYDLFRSFKLFNKFEIVYNWQDYNERPSIYYEEGKMIIKDIWEKK